MEIGYYAVTFDGSGSTSVIARTPDDAVSFGRRLARNGRTNVRIKAPDDRSFTVDELDAVLAAGGDDDGR